MIGEQKITAEHLHRRAVVYLRQSSEGQVKYHVESQQLQYALVSRAEALGFGDVEVVDTDLGASAAIATKRREGFERLLGAVALGEVGLILRRELSRLLRTDKDFASSWSGASCLIRFLATSTPSTMYGVWTTSWSSASKPQ